MLKCIVISIFLVFVVARKTVSSQNIIFHIGVIVDEPSPKQSVFNLYSEESPQERSFDLKFISKIQEPNNPFAAVKTTCNLLENKVVAIFGPSNDKNAQAILGVCDNKEIAFVETRWDLRRDTERSLINLHPYPATIGNAVVDLVRFLGWTEFTLFYQKFFGLMELRGLLEMNNGTDGTTVIVRCLESEGSKDYRKIFKDAQESGETHFLIDSSTGALTEILEQAQQVGLVTAPYNFIITNLDAQTIDLHPYQYGGANILTISLVDLEAESVVTATEKLQESCVQDAESDCSVFSKLQTEVALTLDAVAILEKSLEKINPDDIKVTSCDDFTSSKHGYSLLNYMKTNNIEGTTGNVKFDNEGLRTDFVLNILRLKEDGLKKVGTWSSKDSKITFDDGTETPSEADESSLRNIMFRVQTALTPPYAMLRQSTAKLLGNDQYEGFGIDLIHELSKMEGFKYEFSLREDKANGAKLKNGTWTGMIGDIIANKVDLAITDLTITAEREEAVEFTTPFMSLGVSILYRKPGKAPPSFFSFAAPFALEVWLLLAGATFGVSISLYIMGRLCPAEWSNPYPCVEEPKYLVNQFSLRNSFWFAVGSLMQQGSEIAPVGVSTRMVAGIWWFFTLIMVSCYTANLAASLTSESPEQHFSNLKELVERADRIGIKYGAKKGGATEAFFKQGAKNKTEFKIVYEHMQNFKSEMVQDNTIGVERAEEGKYAFFMESTSIEYEIQRHCNLTQVGSKLDEKGYGIAMRKNSNYRHRLSTALLKLQSTGVIDDLKRKWWEEKGGQCSNEEPPSEAPPLDFKNVSGIFWVTIGGTTSAMLVVIVELILHTFKGTVGRRTFREQLRKEIQFYFKFDEFVKPVHKSEMSLSENHVTNSRDNVSQANFKHGDS